VKKTLDVRSRSCGLNWWLHRLHTNLGCTGYIPLNQIYINFVKAKLVDSDQTYHIFSCYRYSTTSSWIIALLISNTILFKYIRFYKHHTSSGLGERDYRI